MTKLVQVCHQALYFGDQLDEILFNQINNLQMEL